MSFVCPIHGYYAPTPGATVALCPACSAKPPAPAIERRASRCPVCEGRGHVPAGFYLSTAGLPWSTGSTTPERCKSCDGTGVVWPSMTVAVSGSAGVVEGDRT